MLARIWTDTENARDFVPSYSSHLIVVPWNYDIITIVDFVATTYSFSFYKLKIPTVYEFSMKKKIKNCMGCL